MDSAAATSDLLKSLRNTVNCSVCQDIFKDPVTLDCGHNFCQSCITQRWEGFQINFPCPQCRKRFRNGNIRPNPQLEEIAKLVRALAMKGSEGEKGCKKHQKPLTLFCCDHGTPICEDCDLSLEHQRDYVHPIEDVAEQEKGRFQRLIQECTSQKEAREVLKLNEEKKIATLLTKTETERQEIVSHFERHQILKEEEQRLLGELDEMEKVIQESKNEYVTKLSEEISHYVEYIAERKEACQKTPAEICTTKTETERQEIVSHFERHQILKEEEQRLLGELDEMEKVIQESKNEYVTKLSEEISHYVEYIAERKEACQKTPAEICTIYKSLKNSWPKYFPEPEPVYPELEKSFCSFYQKFKVLKDAVIIKRTDVTLDPETAHPTIAVSEDGRSARKVSTQTVPDSPKRFETLLAVLGSEGFNSGRHCWETEVGLGQDWAVGIATESVERKGIMPFQSPHGLWSVWMKENNAHPSYWAPAPEDSIPATMGDPAVMPTGILAPTSRSKTPIKIRVCLDYERGMVTFYRSDNMAPPFTYYITFTEKIFPFFWLWSAGAWVRLCP